MLVSSFGDIKKFQEYILDWYGVNKRDLPWRRTRDPYAILVSEVMSQQTQIARVVPKYEAWMLALPTVGDLAMASQAVVLGLWSGLGYNRRALYLQRCAQEIYQNTQKTQMVGKSEGQNIGDSEDRIVRDGWPDTEEGLMLLPGIGKYTARAILCFAFDRQVAVVDTNVRKVIVTQFQRTWKTQIVRDSDNRSFGVSESQNVRDFGEVMDEKVIYVIAEMLLPVGRAYEWNQALMDYAGAMLKKEKIPVAKQSKFVGSRRYYRGRILKLLLKRGEVSVGELVGVFDKGEELVRGVLGEMEKEGFIGVREERVVLKK